MNRPIPSPSLTVGFLWSMLGLYLLARVSQVYADRLPVLIIVSLHVVPPALFAVVHGSLTLGRRGMAVFSAICLGIGSCAELFSLRTGFPFGSYHFTSVMGPQILDVPILLALAYLGIGYCAWIMALQILGFVDRRLSGAPLLAVPVLASSIMTAWDLAMDPDWATLDRAWIWHRGGAYFGVPVSNFFGWFGTACAYYAAFAFYSRGRTATYRTPAAVRCLPALLYAICALGNLLILRLPMAPAVVLDASGSRWQTSDILMACAVVSLSVMAPFAALAFARAAKCPHV